MVFSNSVIEHAGNYEKQKRMAAEMQRAGVHYYLQTPNKWFFMEPHFSLIAQTHKTLRRFQLKLTCRISAEEAVISSMVMYGQRKVIEWTMYSLN